MMRHSQVNDPEPAPERNRKTTWKEFLFRQWEVLVAADSFTVEVWTRRGPTRFVVLFLTDLSTRRVEIAGVLARADGLWMDQVARNLSDDVDGFLIRKRYLIHDRDPLFTAEFLGTLAASRVQSVKLPPRSAPATCAPWDLRLDLRVHHKNWRLPHETV